MKARGFQLSFEMNLIFLTAKGSKTKNEKTILNVPTSTGVKTSRLLLISMNELPQMTESIINKIQDRNFADSEILCFKNLKICFLQNTIKLLKH